MKNPVTKLLKKLFRKKKNKSEKGKKYAELSESANFSYYSMKKESPKKPAENDYSEYKATKKTAPQFPVALVAQPPVAGFDDLRWLTKSNRGSRDSIAPEEIMKKAAEDDKKEESPVQYRKCKQLEARSISQSVFNLNNATEPQSMEGVQDVYAFIIKKETNLKSVKERKPTPYREEYSHNPIENYRKTQQRYRSPPPKYQTYKIDKRDHEVRKPRLSMPYTSVQQCRCGNHQKENGQTRKDFIAPDLEILLDDAYIRMRIAKKLMKMKRSKVDLAFYESQRAETQYEAVKNEFLNIRQRRMSMPARGSQVYKDEYESRNIRPTTRNPVREQNVYDF